MLCHWLAYILDTSWSLCASQWLSNYFPVCFYERSVVVQLLIESHNTTILILTRVWSSFTINASQLSLAPPPRTAWVLHWSPVSVPCRAEWTSACPLQDFHEQQGTPSPDPDHQIHESLGIWLTTGWMSDGWLEWTSWWKTCSKWWEGCSFSKMNLSNLKPTETHL